MNANALAAVMSVFLHMLGGAVTGAGSPVTGGVASHRITAHAAGSSQVGQLVHADSGVVVHARHGSGANSTLYLIHKHRIDPRWVRHWVTPMLNNPPAGWPYPGRVWYSGLLESKDLEKVWVVCAPWTERTWLKGYARPEITVGLAVQNWHRHPSGIDYEAIADLVSHYKGRCTDSGRWLILAEDNRDGQRGIVVADGNHRAIASVLAGCPSIPVLVAVSPQHASWVQNKVSPQPSGHGA